MKVRMKVNVAVLEIETSPLLGFEKEKDAALDPTRSCISASAFFPVSGESHGYIYINRNLLPETRFTQIERGGAVFSVRTRSEKELLRRLHARLAQTQKIVTFGGRRFDLPYITARSIFNSVPLETPLEYAPWESGRHFDVHDRISLMGVMPGMSLQACVRAIGDELGEQDFSLGVGSKEFLEYLADKCVATAVLFAKAHEVLSGATTGKGG